jgi:hypothetical protein
MGWFIYWFTMRTQIVSTVLLLLVYIANYLSTNGVLWGEMTNLASVFPFPYMPPGWTFMIAWTLIYVSLWGYLVFTRSKQGQTSKNNEVIAPWFRASCILNILWIFSTVAQRYTISIALIFGLMLVLGYILHLISKQTLSKKERRMMSLPFGLYYGWVSLATSILWTSQLVYQRHVELPLWQTWTIVVIGLWLLVATYSWLKRRNLWQLLISLFAFAWIASVLF